MSKDTQRLIDDWSRNSPDMLVQSCQAVDTKMVGALAAGSVVIGVAATAVEPGFLNNLSSVPLIMSILMYVVILISAVKCLRPIRLARPSNPKFLRGQYSALNPDELREKHSNLVLKTYKTNLKTLEGKTKMLNCALISLGGETVAIIGWVVLKAFEA